MNKQIEKLTIIIVTFNSSKVIESCLEKINFNTCKTYIVDNNSQDNTIEIIEDKFPAANIIKLDQNIGYGRANNIALNKTKTKYALILNPDAFIEEEDVNELLKLMSADKTMALSNPTINSEKDYPYAKKNQHNKESFNKVDFVGGGVMLMNMSLFNQIGFFDEDIFMFSEDNEICQRALDNGYKNVIFTGPVACHLGGKSSGQSLRTIYRRFWHLGWSKSHYRKKRKGYFGSKRSTLRLTIYYFFEAMFYLLKQNKEKYTSKIAFSAGCASSLIGLKAFKKNGIARG
jgi:N-acetylglucosaminyl-diphospho-decaprenol L-rhamnosyltransferase